jgi:hypothetical protein
MELFDGLHEALGNPEIRTEPPRAFFDSLEASVDEDLVALWQQDGWACYSGGLFWTVNPQGFSELAKDWNIVPPLALVFGRNAFGDLFLLQEGEVFRLAVQWNRLMGLGPSTYIFLNSTIKEPSLQESLLQKKLFKAVHKRLGNLAVDECYGLFPALSLGGNDEDPNAYRRVKLPEYLALLAQMHA